MLFTLIFAFCPLPSAFFQETPAGSDSISFYATVHVGKAGALSPHLASFNEYLRVVSDYMRKGEVYSDVAAYLPLEDAWIAGEMPKEKQLPWAWGEYEFRYRVVPEEVRGWQPLWINRSFLEEGRRQRAEGRNQEKGLRMEDGACSFRSLYVEATHLDHETLKTIVGLAGEGFPVCVRQEPSEAGYVKHPDFSRLAARLMELSSPDLSKVMKTRPLVEGKELPYFWCRKDKKTYYIFFAHPMAKEFRYPVRYGQADTDQEDHRKVTIHIQGKTHNVDLRFKPYESLLLEISPRGALRFIDLPSIN